MELLSDVSHNVSFGYMKKHLIIDPNIDKFQKIQHPEQRMLGHFRRISNKDKIAFETTRLAVRKLSGKSNFSYYPCMNKSLNYES